MSIYSKTGLRWAGLGVVAAILLAGCNVSVPRSVLPPAESSAAEHSAPPRAPDREEELSAEEAEDAPWAPQRPGESELLTTQYWREHTLGNTLHPFQTEYQRGDPKNIQIVSWYIAERLAEDGRLTDYPFDDGSVWMPLSDFQYFLDKFFGLTVDEVDYFQDDGKESYIQGNQVRLILPHDLEYGAPWDSSYNDWLFSGMDLMEVYRSGQGDGERYHLTIHRYDIWDEDVLDRVETRTFFWDQDEGLIIESISWEYPETNRVSVEGNLLVLLETVLDLDLEYPETLPTLGDRAYHFQLDDVLNTLTYNAVDLVTLEESQGPVYDFSGELVLNYGVRNHRLFVRTDKALYRFDKDLQLEKTQALPDHVAVGVTIIFNEELTLAAFTDEKGLYVLDLTGEGDPVLLLEHPNADPELMVDYQMLYPISFVTGDKIYAGISVWEATGGYYVVDPATGEADKIDLIGSDIYGAATLHNDKVALYLYPGNETEEDCYYYDFETGVLRGADSWFPIENVWVNWYFQSSFSTPDLEYMSYVEGPLNQPDYTAFVRVDFAENRIVQIPLTVHGAKADLLAVGESGRMLFSYAYLGERGFGIYTPE